jgi:hypothetical protein
MAEKKSNSVKTYLNRIATKEQLYLLLGSTQSTIQANDTNDAALTMWKDSEIAYKISRGDTVAVVPNYTWAKSNVYVPWSSVKTNSSKYYVYNKTHGIVYLCISNNNLNRIDLETKNASTSIPNHEYGISRYEDGYEWLALFKITPSLLRFVSTNWIPVVSLDDFSEDESLSQYGELSNFCNQAPTNTGNCGVYFKENYRVPFDSITDTVYAQGDLYATLENMTCSQCYMLFQDPESLYVSEFFGSSTPDSTISITTTQSKVKDLIDRSILSSASPYYWLYYSTENGVEDGAIVSCLIDLSSYSESDLYVTSANPSLTITSSTGTGATINLKTYVNSLGEYVIEGVELTNRGSGYKDIKLEVPSGVLKNISSSTLISSIEINLDEVDGLGIDPVKTLDARHVSTSARISLTELANSDISVPSSINFYGIVRNPLERISNTTTTAGTSVGKYKSSVSETVVKVTVSGLATIPQADETVSLSSLSDDAFSIGDVVVAGTETGFVDTTIKLKTIDDRGIANMNVLTYDGDDYTITGYELPDLVFYSGSTETVKKIDPISVGTDTENTKYFSITSIKAL